VCCTVNIFNILYLADVANWIYKQGFDYIYWNLLHDAPWLSIAHLPVEIKTKIVEHLEMQLFPQEFQEEMQKIIEFMQLGKSNSKQELIMNIQQLDVRRNESLKAVAPELATILNYD
jgi:hypothetical protein